MVFSHNDRVARNYCPLCLTKRRYDLAAEIVREYNWHDVTLERNIAGSFEDYDMQKVREVFLQSIKDTIIYIFDVKRDKLISKFESQLDKMGMRETFTLPPSYVLFGIWSSHGAVRFDVSSTDTSALSVATTDVGQYIINVIDDNAFSFDEMGKIFNAKWIAITSHIVLLDTIIDDEDYATGRR